MFYINWQLALFVMVFLPIVFYFMNAYGKLARNYFKGTMMKMGNINKYIVEAARGAKIIRAYNKEEKELDMAQASIKELLRNLMRVQRAQSASGPSAELIVGFGMAALFFYVGYEGRAGNFSQGDLVWIYYGDAADISAAQGGCGRACRASSGARGNRARVGAL